MNDFDIEMKTKVQLVHALFERRKLDLEMQLKTFETKHHLLQQKHEPEIKQKRTD